MSRAGIVILLFLSCLSGCTSKSESLYWKSRQLEVLGNKFLQVQPVSNATGGIVSQEFLSLLTGFLKKQFAVHNLLLLESPPAGNEALLVQTEILEYGFN